MSAFDHLGSLLNGVSHLLEQHLKLARLELAADATAMGKRVAIIAAMLIPVFVGYAFVCAAAALLLARQMPMEGAFALVGVANLIAAAIGITAAARQLSDRPMLKATMTELEATSVAVRGELGPQGGA